MKFSKVLKFAPTAVLVSTAVIFLFLFFWLMTGSIALVAAAVATNSFIEIAVGIVVVIFTLFTFKRSTTAILSVGGLFLCAISSQIILWDLWQLAGIIVWAIGVFLWFVAVFKMYYGP
ncbi:MAG: hypothetical protein WC461_00125 [Candidatus Paceibacterota bacterium]